MADINGWILFIRQIARDSRFALLTLRVLNLAVEQTCWNGFILRSAECEYPPLELVSFSINNFEVEARLNSI
jgi:hypothetical protein